MLGCLAGNFGTVIVHGDEINKTVARSPVPDSAESSASIIGGTGGPSVDPGYFPLFILVHTHTQKLNLNNKRIWHIRKSICCAIKHVFTFHGENILFIYNSVSQDANNLYLSNCQYIKCILEWTFFPLS